MLKIILIFIVFYGNKVKSDKNVHNVLLLGGNGLLGSAVTQMLLRVKDVKYNITILNRGNWYWDTENIIKPFVNHIKCSREDGFREMCTQLADNTKYDSVVDFSAYDPLDIEDILIVMPGRFKRYIYISSDSVYEVCLPKKHDGYLREEDAVRPTDQTVLEKYNSRDNYGHKKLEGEEVLDRFHKVLDFDYISLRLPDVIGPRDNTNRFWKYYMWAKINHIAGPVHITPNLRDKPLSFVYSLDVGGLIANLVHPNFNMDGIFNQAYNLGFKETVTLKQFVDFVGKFANTSIQFDETDQAVKNFGFPSVSIGPVDINNAMQLLKWQPTDLYTALEKTSQFYEDAEYDDEYKFIVDRILNALDVHQLKRHEFLLFHHERQNSRHNKDEL
ncbi:uncharacterized protein LOC130644534 [Hydractinia symbiolongicarpus]|uniref:uncharacterized protein LOC130644534 n=1 Tax=Hydractinia symbiolongicarpus TaxID=13093 RepID=UPI00254BDA28|nr:uncharacterized protein LOC130644534 [Hydractinia symbiolongicarpus]